MDLFPVAPPPAATTFPFAEGNSRSPTDLTLKNCRGKGGRKNAVAEIPPPLQRERLPLSYSWRVPLELTRGSFPATAHPRPSFPRPYRNVGPPYEILPRASDQERSPLLVFPMAAASFTCRRAAPRKSGNFRVAVVIDATAATKNIREGRCGLVASDAVQVRRQVGRSWGHAPN